MSSHRAPVWRAWLYWARLLVRIWVPVLLVWTAAFIVGLGYHDWHTGFQITGWGTIAIIMINLPGLARGMLFSEWKRHTEGRDR